LIDIECDNGHYKTCRLEHEKEGKCSGQCKIITMRNKASRRFGGENTACTDTNSNTRIDVDSGLYTK